jgi:SlyX protein
MAPSTANPDSSLSSKVPDDRLQELETRLTFQEHMIEELNDALSRQQLLISDMETTVRVLLERTRQIIDDDASTVHETDEKPPHY